MTDDKLFSIVKGLNNAQLGSLGNESGEEEIEYIIAYPHSHLCRLPHIAANNRQRNKRVDQVLDLPGILYSFRKFYFRDTDELMSEYFKRFPVSNS